MFQRCKHHFSSEIIQDQDFTEEIFLTQPRGVEVYEGEKKTALLPCPEKTCPILKKGGLKEKT